jgi:LPS-assembly protein
MIVKKIDFKACILRLSTARALQYTLFGLGFISLILVFVSRARADNTTTIQESVQACVVDGSGRLTLSERNRYENCLGWQADSTYALCKGYYTPINMSSIPEGQVKIKADQASLYSEGRSKLEGHVEVRESQRMVNAQTAYLYRDPKTNQVSRVELFGDVRYSEPGRFMVASKAIINPQDKSGRVENVLYRLNTDRANATLPAWGKASFIERYANQDYLLNQATYTTCPPKDRAWLLSAKSIELNHAESKGVAKNAVLRLHDVPVLYTPYISFPTAKVRKSGFLIPVVGYSNVGGFDLGLPYYWNIAPNYDATITPHLYTRRGVMMGGSFRYLNERSFTTLGGQFLPNDRAFNRFVLDNEEQFPSLRGQSDNRWYASINNKTLLAPSTQLNVNFQEVSDDYYLQDFSTNLATTTQSQILRQADLSFSSEHWTLMGMVQGYQTLHPINQSTVSDIYQRLPEISANGTYANLPWNGTFNLLAQVDNYRWPAQNIPMPQGPRAHINPILSFSNYKPWGYITPSVQVVENNYSVKYTNNNQSDGFNRLIPRYSVDSGLFFDRSTLFMGDSYTQTLEPRLYYLYVPYHDQTPIPVYDSAYMIFNTDQLFRNNRFSGFDRIGDSNQIEYAITSRLLSDKKGGEKASLSVGQIQYFANRRVSLCYNLDENCVDNPLTLGYVSPYSKSSPIATRTKYHINPSWVLMGDYVWDPYTSSTNNGYLNLHYQPEYNKIISLGYTYLVNGDITRIANTPVVDNVLNQATLAYAWPLSDKWSTLGVYSHNISKRYSMMSFLGVQYEDCCWALRLMGGRTFKNLSATNLNPQYNNNVFLQVLLKGLGSAASSDPSTVINSYLPGYVDIFKR